MLTHEVSKIPINLKTPSRISRITSGGARKDRISDKASDFIPPTADLAEMKNKEEIQKLKIGTLYKKNHSIN